MDVDISLGDTWDALSDVDGGFVLHYEGTKAPWSILADVLYARIKSTQSTVLGPVEFRPSVTIGELAGAYEVLRKPGMDQQLTTVDALLGARYQSLKLSLTTPAGNVAKGSQSWVDPIVGARVIYRFSPQWAFGARGDVGGFGISGDSDFVWNAIVSLRYGLSNAWGLYLGWRWLDYDFQTGSGTDEFKYDVLMQGPFLGVEYSF